MSLKQKVVGSNPEPYLLSFICEVKFEIYSSLEENIVMEPTHMGKAI